jgi:hypothetical protein
VPPLAFAVTLPEAPVQTVSADTLAVKVGATLTTVDSMQFVVPVLPVVNQYVPASLAETFESVGFWLVLVNPFGPVQE